MLFPKIICFSVLNAAWVSNTKLCVVFLNQCEFTSFSIRYSYREPNPNVHLNLTFTFVSANFSCPTDRLQTSLIHNTCGHQMKKDLPHYCSKCAQGFNGNTNASEENPTLIPHMKRRVPGYKLTAAFSDGRHKSYIC